MPFSPTRLAVLRAAMLAALFPSLCGLLAAAEGDPTGSVATGQAPRAAGAAAQAGKPAMPVVMVYGDRFALNLARGLEDDAGDWLTVTSVINEDAGLTRADFAPWLAAMRVRLQRPDRAALALVMLGVNDRGPLPDGDSLVVPASPRWAALYAARVDAVVTLFHEAGVPLIWVGLPNVQIDEVSAQIVRLNALFRDGVRHEDGSFVDTWEAFSDETGAYRVWGPDVDGRIVKLRKSDGIGFTRAGARKLASFVDKDIKGFFRPGGSPGAPPVTDIRLETTREFDEALDIDVNAQVRRAVGLAPSAEGSKAAAGPVLSLTAAPLSAGGTLASADLPTSALRQAAVTQPASTEGATPGRADDFSWPKP